MTIHAAIIVAAGRGERAGGGVPKQYRTLSGMPLWKHAASALSSDKRIGPIQLVIGPGQEELFARDARGMTLLPPVIGGATRQESVRRGLEALAIHRPDFVLIHDGARPLPSRSLLDRVIAALEQGAEAVVPMLPVTDTLRARKPDGRWAFVSRDGLYRAQTPQGFRFAKILDAHRQWAGQNVTDDIALAEFAGFTIEAVAGDEMNLKITVEEDFALAERMIAQGFEFRTGLGFDAHRFSVGDHVWMCGVRIPHDHGLEGHSDADAGLHAITDALLGALSKGDIGEHFPPSDPRWKGAASSQFLEHAARLAAEINARVMHCDVTLIAERPRMAPYREAMCARIAEILQIERERVSVKATTTEGMGFTGRREGLAAQAIVTIRKST